MEVDSDRRVDLTQIALAPAGELIVSRQGESSALLSGRYNQLLQLAAEVPGIENLLNSFSPFHFRKVLLYGGRSLKLSLIFRILPVQVDQRSAGGSVGFIFVCGMRRKAIRLRHPVRCLKILSQAVVKKICG